MSNSLKEAALAYANQGYHVFPCLPKSKVPATKDGFKSATTDEQVINNWWSINPDYNVAIACGAASNLTVLDIDGEEGWKSAKELGIEGVSVATPTGGAHIYYEYEAGLKNKVRVRPGLDIRTEGGYVVAAPSIHPNGGQYVVLGDEKNPFPRNIKQLIEEPTPVTRSEPAGTEDVLEGGRNHYLTKLAGTMRRAGMEQEAILAALLETNQLKCVPPLSEREVATIASSVARYTPDAIVVDNLKAELLPREGSQLVSVADLGTSSIDYLRDKDKVKGLPTGMADLDKMLGGGKRLGEVTCWHAEAKTGKNTFWHYLMHMWLEAGVKIAYASRELTPESEVVPNLLSLAFNENAWLASLEGNEGAERASRYQSKISTWPLFFSAGYGYFPLEDIVAWVDKGIAAGVQYFWFDHLHYMLEDPEEHKSASKLIKELKTLAKQKNIHIDIIIQPNKLMDGQRLSLNSIKGGAAMGQAIDNLIILERVKQEGVSYITKLTLEVARSKLCKPGSMYIKYNPDTTEFVEVEQDEVAPKPEPEEDDPTDHPPRSVFHRGFGYR